MTYADATVNYSTNLDLSFFSALMIVYLTKRLRDFPNRHKAIVYDGQTSYSFNA
jgi:hypothetical protein